MKQQLRAEILASLKNVNYINGKYFNNDEEILYIDKYLSRTICNNLGYLCNDSDLKEVKTLLINWSDPGDKWPELPIVKEARRLGKLTKDDGVELPFPLEPKQLMIINRLLFHPEDEVMFITTGVGGSGKSTFLNIIKQLFNNDCYSASVSDLSNNFVVAEAVKHRLIASDELAKGDLDTKVLKTLASKQNLAINPKNLPPHEVKTQSALFWCCNIAPRIDCTDTGILRRIIFYERNTKIANPDKSLNSKHYSYEELLIIARRSLAYEDDEWDKYFKEESHYYIMKDNSVYLCDANTYSEYKELCSAKGLKAYSEPNWITIKRLFDEWKMQDIM